MQSAKAVEDNGSQSGSELNDGDEGGLDAGMIVGENFHFIRYVCAFVTKSVISDFEISDNKMQ